MDRTGKKNIETKTKDMERKEKREVKTEQIRREEKKNEGSKH